MEKKDKIFRSFEDLECYQACRTFRISISQLCSKLPKAEERRLKDQMLRASRSVTANIAEGFGRHHHQENLQFCRQARGSLTEMLDHLMIAKDEGMVDAETFKEMRDQLETAWRLLNGYIAYLGKCSEASKAPSRNRQPTTDNRL